MKIDLFADGANVQSMLEMNSEIHIRGFTTNPTLMRKAGIKNYKAFAQEILSEIKEKPVSFEVFSDDFEEMKRQALEIASWADNVNVKIPITNTTGQLSGEVVTFLVDRQVTVNVTAIMTTNQMTRILRSFKTNSTGYLSIFAGRIADTGRDPIPYVKESLDKIQKYPNLKIIWASPRELLNVIQADSIGCHIITVDHSLLGKLKLLNKDLEAYSLETVTMFRDDALSSGFSL